MLTQRASSKSNRRDARVLDATLLKLRLPGWIWRAAVLLVAVLVWIWLCATILEMGGMVSYTGLEALGPEVVKILTRVNPYLWWGVVAILTLIVLSIVRAWLVRSGRQLRARIVPLADIQTLARKLTPEGVEVVQWAWDADHNPVTIGDLLTARNEIRGGRVRKLALARAQRQALADALVAVEGGSTASSASSWEHRLSPEPSVGERDAQAAPVVSVIDEPVLPHAQSTTEPTLSASTSVDAAEGRPTTRDGKVEPSL